MNEENSDHCIICESYEDLLFLMDKGLSMEEAFHEVVTHIAYSVIEDAVDVGFDSGETQGFKEGYETAASIFSDPPTFSFDEEMDEQDLEEYKNIQEFINMFNENKYYNADEVESEVELDEDKKYYDDREIEFVAEGDFAEWLKERM